MCSDGISDGLGGFFVCTPKQYIIGYNSNFGSGAHITAYARVMKDIMGGGKISSMEELTFLGTRCTDEYICGRIVYEKSGFDNYGMPLLKGLINFSIKNNSSTISNSMFESFKKFYEDYNREISLACNKPNDHFIVSFFDKDNKKRVESKNLDLLYAYLENHIDETLDDEVEENIIGVKSKENIIKN